jgi:hypothetical protein
MSDEDVEIGDIDADDVHDDNDGEVDWSNVEKVASQVESIDAIDYDDERLEAAKAWAAELGGES